ncbi:hypothetical protein NDU88_003181 [Pleurodeles waltl]|uniref:Uncharacterized protein n=1 Tax=Pleurodeles waltl TaxID=8319 RepID=A0AAV7Q894_PLEWA|nr:hypothetical protein NDU88_003181 [Pleurodeles waltl]
MWKIQPLCENVCHSSKPKTLKEVVQAVSKDPEESEHMDDDDAKNFVVHIIFAKRAKAKTQQPLPKCKIKKGNHQLIATIDSGAQSRF